MMDIPSGKLRDKGTPIDNLSKYDGSKEKIVFLTNFGRLTGQHAAVCHKNGHGETGSGGRIYHK